MGNDRYEHLQGQQGRGRGRESSEDFPRFTEPTMVLHTAFVFESVTPIPMHARVFRFGYPETLWRGRIPAEHEHFLIVSDDGHILIPASLASYAPSGHSPTDVIDFMIGKSTSRFVVMSEHMGHPFIRMFDFVRVFPDSRPFFAWVWLIVEETMSALPDDGKPKFELLEFSDDETE